MKTKWKLFLGWVKRPTSITLIVVAFGMLGYQINREDVEEGAENLGTVGELVDILTDEGTGDGTGKAIE